MGAIPPRAHTLPARAKNSNTDTLSRYPIGSLAVVPTVANPVANPVAAIEPDLASSKGGDRSVTERQDLYSTLVEVRRFLRDGSLPSDEKVARKLLLDHTHYTLIDDLLYRVMKDCTLRLVPPSEHRRSLFQEAHAGAFGGHLRDHKVHSQLSCHYWWEEMRRDIVGWCRACVTCATRRVGRPVRPPLVPLPVARAFDRVGVDVIQFVRSDTIVFVDYLTKWVEVFAAPDQTALTIARLFVDEIISRHGVPRELLSD